MSPKRISTRKVLSSILVSLDLKTKQYIKPLLILRFSWIDSAALAAYFLSSFLRKEVIQPHLPIRLPCYDFTPVTCPAFGSSLLAVRPPASSISDSHGVTGGVYKTRERIHRSILICDY